MDLDQHRSALSAYCYRMLGSPFDAEDAVQETFLRAWRSRERYDPSRPLRAWLFTIATNVCLDALRSATRRRGPLVGAPATGPDIGAPLPETAWVLPAPVDPAMAVEERESVRLAFVAALQVLPPKQRAVLILRDVLAWRAEEVAGLLSTSVAAVNSALQRARAALPAVPPSSDPDPALLEAYCAAFLNHDVEGLVALLHEDATMSMPPFTWWLRGRDAIGTAFSHADACVGHTLVPVRGGFGQYDAAGRPFAVVGIEAADGLVTATTTWLMPELFAVFGLPMSSPAPTRSGG
ncbi:RNA polymerase subunit sigma-70 [Actinokineospora sp. UTMC 2448]|uniref:RNA polymerase subunit sigma-70 n=1 Tax=Actinokineospora sp. UTMC 2448 TaxID=2268449 RepID=UPI002164EC3B|nr:RNA polymerase subunit sigma-70 [Actinokineospora sp. UTMC 2448]UVS81016.1 Sigma-W factor [Actinokineospora sp. UTMC 2448]